MKDPKYFQDPICGAAQVSTRQVPHKSESNTIVEGREHRHSARLVGQLWVSDHTLHLSIRARASSTAAMQFFVLFGSSVSTSCCGNAASAVVFQ